MVDRVGSRRLSVGWMWTDARVKCAVLAVGLMALAVQQIKTCAAVQGDFPYHWRMGLALASGDFIYGVEVFHNPYPPFWGLVHAPLGLLPMHLGQLLISPLFLVCLVLLVWLLGRLTERHYPLDRHGLFWAAALALLLSSRYLMRDMPECGVNLSLVALSYLGVYLWTRRREWLGGMSLGLAMALKCTPGLFLLFFLWKRQWKMAATTLLAAAAFTLSPLLVMGPARYCRAMSHWTNRTVEGLGQGDPSTGVLGEEPLRNISLRPALARFLVHLPEGHPGRPDHPGYLDVLDLPPQTAGWVVRGLTLALLAAVAWNLRHPVKQRDDLKIVWQCAAVSLVILLLSPITWKQHCVGVLPALYLIVRQSLWSGTLSRPVAVFLGLYVATILLLNPTFLGRNLILLPQSYHLATWVLLAFTVIVSRLCPAAKGAADTAAVPFPPGPRRAAAA